MTRRFISGWLWRVALMCMRHGGGVANAVSVVFGGVWGGACATPGTPVGPGG